MPGEEAISQTDEMPEVVVVEVPEEAKEAIQVRVCQDLSQDYV